jgi:hypothetical protein
MDITEILKRDDTFQYGLLSRTQSDCKYYLGYGNRYNKHLWALDEKKHIDYMKAIWNNFKEDEKPEWLTLEQIEKYEKEMIKGE